jgi:putative oxygen-independent coproporphyrinogen III oxidase
VPGRLPEGELAPADGALPPSALSGLGTRAFGVYIHVPFCASRCGYCDFTTYTASELGGTASQATYADDAIAELHLARRVLGDVELPVSTVFFGGGTPTLLPSADLVRILAAVRSAFGLAPDVEVTTEANPESVDEGSLAELRAGGFTRISFGMQSARPHVLAMLDRRHTPGRAVAAVDDAHAAGFEHVNLDLIYGAPYETDADWQASLEAAVAAGPDHLSAYALIVEEGTALARQVAAGVVPPPDDDAQADRYVLADELLRAAGYEWYEISNWAAAPGARCRHNELYWSDANWWGFGPGAHSHVSGVRWWNVKHPARYTALVDNGRSPAAGRETLDEQARFTERVMLGVRRRTGLDVGALPPTARAVLPQLSGWGLVEPADLHHGRLVLSQRGRLMADAVVKELLAAG